MHSFPFFVGRARSGTTLLRTIFDNHSQLAIPPESHFIVTLYRSGRTKQAFSWAAFLEELWKHPRFALWEMPRDDVIAHFRSAAPQNYPDAIRLLFSLYAARRGKPRHGDKTPTYVYHLTLLGNLFPEARFVHIIRDGRDASLSFLETEFASGGIEEAAFAWKVGVTRARRAGRALGPSRYLEVSYENLIADAESIVRTVSGFLDLDFEQQMLTYFQRSESALKATMHPSAHQRLRLAPTKGRDWRQTMDRRDLETFELIAGDLLEDLGYERVTKTKSLPARGRALRLQAQRLRRRMTRFL